jgi:uncharacterized protein (DUF433 family)
MSQSPSLSTIVRTERGLSIAGTRITLYTVMDYLKAGWPTKLIQHWLNLDETQIADILDYIALHESEVEKEYQIVLQHAKENRAYWEQRNQAKAQEITKLHLSDEQKAIQAKIQARKTELGLR